MYVTRTTQLNNILYMLVERLYQLLKIIIIQLLFGHHVVHQHRGGTQETLHSTVSHAMTSQDLLFKTAHIVLYLVIPLESVIFRMSSLLLAMSRQIAPMVTYV